VRLGDLFLRILADDSGFTADVVKKADAAGAAGGKAVGDRLGKGAKAGLVAGIASAVTTKAISLVGDALHRVTEFLGDSVKAYQEHQVATGRLTASLNANVPAWRASAGAIREAIDAGVKLGFTDTESTNAMAKLVAATGDVTKATQVLAVARDLARFKGISLTDASDALTKVEAGSYKVLKSLGIQLKANADQTDALAAVEKVAGNQAKTYAESDLGKLEVANAKVDAAQEKLGKGLSKLQAIVLPAAADAVSGLADELDAIQIGFDDTASKEDKLRAYSEAAKNGIYDMIPGISLFKGAIKEAGVEAGKMADDLEAQAAAEATHGDALDGVRSSVRGLTDAERDAHKPAVQTADDISKIARVADIAHDAISGLSSAVADELFGKAITAGHEAQLKDTIKDLEKQRDKAHEGSLKYIELTGEIAQNREELFNLHLEEAAAKGPQAAIDFLDKQRAKFGDASGAIARLIVQYKALITVQGALLTSLTKVAAGKYAGKSIPLFASGGYAPPNEPAIIGDDGPELIVPRGEGLDVIPQPKWGRTFGQRIADRLSDRVGGGPAASSRPGSLAGVFAPLSGLFAPSLVVPQVSMDAVRSGAAVLTEPAASPGDGGGDVFNLYLPDAVHTDPWAVLDRVPRYAKVAKASAGETGWRAAAGR
jgi:hypothetical protein